MPRGRPKKIVGATEWGNAVITPVANGYIVTEGKTAAATDQFVYEKFEDATEFIRRILRPTTEQQKFVDSV
jgi:hypothetical protein